MKKGAVCLILLLAGCGGERRQDDSAVFDKKAFPLKEVPEAIVKVAEKELAGLTIQDAMKKTKKSDGSFVSYEIRAKDPSTGKISEVGIAPDGKVLERE
jgi:hypothetical protein